MHHISLYAAFDSTTLLTTQLSGLIESASCSVGPRPVSLLTLAHMELTGFNGKSNNVGTLGDSLFRLYPLSSPFAMLLYDLKLMPKPQWLPCWMLRNFEAGEV